MRAKNTAMLNTKNLSALNDQFQNAFLPNQHNDFRKDNCSASPAVSMSGSCDSALYIEKHHTETFAVFPENGKEETDGEDAFAALDIDNLFPDDFGSGVGVSRQFKLPMLAADDEDIGSFIPDLNVGARNGSLPSQQVPRGKHLTATNGNEVAPGLQLTPPKVQQIRNQGPYKKNTRSDDRGNRQAEKHLHNANCSNAHPAQVKVKKAPSWPSAPITQDELNGTHGGQKSPRADEFKVPKTPQRRRKQMYNSEMLSMEPLKTNMVDIPTTAALPPSFGSSDLGTFSTLSPPPPPPDSLFESIMSTDAEERSLDRLLGIHSDTKGKHAGSDAGRPPQKHSSMPSPGAQPRSFSSSPYSLLDDTASLLLGCRQREAQLAQRNANFISILPEGFPNEQIPRDLQLEIQKQLPSDFSQQPPSPSSEIPETPNYFGTAGCAVGSNSQGHLYNPGHRPSTIGRAPPHSNENLRPVAKRKRLAMINGNAGKFPKRYAGADAGANRGRHENVLSPSGSLVRVPHSQLSPQWHENEVGPALHSEENHKIRKKKRTRVEDLDPSEVHLCSFDDCRKKFAKKYNLKIHERRHRGDLPFLCPQCAKKFMWQSSFERHLKVHESRAEGSSKRGRNSKRSEDAGPRERRNTCEIVRTSDTMSQLKLNGIKMTVNHREPASLALAMSLCTLNCIPLVELYSTLNVGDSDIVTENEPAAKLADDEKT